MLRTACGACAGSQLEVFLDLGKTPLANTYPASVDETETFYPLQLGRCGNCGLVQMMEVVPDEVIYGEDYGFYSGGSQAQRNYHLRGADWLLKRYTEPARRSMLEIACNDGALLKHFVDAGCPALGIDPAAPAQGAIDSGLPVRREAFTAALARDLRDDSGPRGLIIAYNSMAHISDLSDVLTGIWALMDKDSVAVIEVQYLPDIIAGNMIGQVYHEHRYFHSLTSFKHAAELHQLYVADVQLIELQGGGIRIHLTADPDMEPNPGVGRVLNSERWLTQEATYSGMQGRVDRNRDHLLDLVSAELDAGRQVAGYAAAAKATTILNYYGISSTTLPYVADTTSYKWGRYVPAVKIPIVPPSEVDTGTRLLLTANYLPHLLRADTGFLERGGHWLIAEPAPMLI